MSDIDVPLTNKNFMIYAATHYINHQCFSDEEFIEDLQRIENLKKLFKRFSNGILLDKDPDKIAKLIRILLNNVIIFNNVFEVPAAIRMLFFKMPEYRSEIKTILTFLDIMPESLRYIGDDAILYNSDMHINTNLAEYLRKV